MGSELSDDRNDFLDVVRCAREIVLPGAAGPVLQVPEQRGRTAGYHVSDGCRDLTDGMPTYGSC